MITDIILRTDRFSVNPIAYLFEQNKIWNYDLSYIENSAIIDEIINENNYKDFPFINLKHIEYKQYNNIINKKYLFVTDNLKFKEWCYSNFIILSKHFGIDERIIRLISNSKTLWGFGRFSSSKFYEILCENYPDIECGYKQYYQLLYDYNIFKSTDYGRIGTGFAHDEGLVNIIVTENI